MNALFDLPIDKSLADPVKAQLYLDTINPPTSVNAEHNRRSVSVSVNETEDAAGTAKSTRTENVITTEDATEFRFEDNADGIDWSMAEPVESTRTKLVLDADGYAEYSFTYNGQEQTGGVSPEMFEMYFENIEGPSSSVIFTSVSKFGDDRPDVVYGLMILRDEAGDYYVVMVEPN
jgi:hypothetical protein